MGCTDRTYGGSAMRLDVKLSHELTALATDPAEIVRGSLTDQYRGGYSAARYGLSAAILPADEQARWLYRNGHMAGNRMNADLGT